MAVQKEIIEIEVKGTGEGVKRVDKVTRSFDNLTETIQEQKDITIEFEKELLRLQQILSKTSKANLPAQKAIKGQIVGIKDALKDQRISLKELSNERAKARDSNKKSIKSTNLNTEAVARNYGAIQILDQFTGGLASQFRSAQDATKLFNLSLKGTKTALIATGIGVFVVALGLVVAYWDDIVEFITGANKALERQIELTERSIEVTNDKLELLREEKKLNELRGIDNKELLKQEKELLKGQKQRTLQLITNTKVQIEKEKSLARQATLWESITSWGITNGKITEEEAQKIQDLEDKLISLQKQVVSIDIEIETPEPEPKQKETERDEVTETIGETLERERLLAEGSLEITKEYLDKRLEVVQISEAAELQSNLNLSIGKALNLTKGRQQELDNAKFKKKLRKQDLAEKALLEKQKLAITAQTFGAIADILGTNSKAGKAAAIAQATINTYQGITEVWSSPSALPEPLATIAKIASTATVLASGLSAVKQIKSQKLPNLGGKGTANISSSSAPTTPTPQAIDTSFSTVGATGVNQLAEAIGAQEQQPVQAFVVSSEVTTAQEMDRNVISGATIG